MPDDVLLEAAEVSRSFGGLLAVDRVSLALARGEVHAVIGTNGAGKSTLVNVLAGELAATGGRVRLQGRDVTRWPQPRRARAGLGRSYQRTTIFPRSTVFENCRLAAQAHFQQPWNWWSAAARCPDSTRLAMQSIEHAGLTAQAHRVAGTLSHGQKRQLEIALQKLRPLTSRSSSLEQYSTPALTDLEPTHCMTAIFFGAFPSDGRSSLPFSLRILSASTLEMTSFSTPHPSRVISHASIGSIPVAYTIAPTSRERFFARSS